MAENTWVCLGFFNPTYKTRWWQLKYFLFSPLFGEDEPILTSIFFRWVGKNHQPEELYSSF